jgi:hypothetical protein
MRPSNHPSPGAALLIGLLVAAAGVVPMLAAFDIGPLRREDIEGPRWLALAAGGAFVMAGFAIIAGPQSPLPARIFGTLTLAALAAIGNWFAFGGGEGVCMVGVALPLAWSRGLWSGPTCVTPFALGALITDAFVAWSVVATLQRALGGPPRLARLLKAAEWLILASLVPILLLLLVLALLGGGAQVVKDRLRRRPPDQPG